ncbi:MAG: Flavodoxin/nitric oxide synthase [Chlamydiales bacterium]|jgi:NAD(P)H dehydrogenase (quinone)|nr:Flavodoxin/nitric oxide synthase [Chlamydiales bacterium]
MARIVIVYHSGYGHTKKLAQSVEAGALEAGAQVTLLAVDQIDEAAWVELRGAHAIIFGAPTYMGGVSADFKKFADSTSKIWFAQQWKDKIAAGFTNSASMNGDKHSSLQYLMTFAMQHGMIWAGTGMLPSNSKVAERNDVNYMGSSIGLMAQSPSDSTPEEGPLPGDLETGRLFGARMASLADRFSAE